MIGAQQQQAVNLRGDFNIMTPRGEAAAVMMLDYGRERETVFYGHLIADGSLVRAEAREVKVIGEVPAKVAQAFEPLLTMGVIQAGLGPDHGFDITNLTTHQMAVNRQRGEVEAAVWMPYYKFLTSLLLEVAGLGVRNLVGLRKSVEDGTATARRIDGMIARGAQKLKSIARAAGVGPMSHDPRFMEAGENNAREVEAFLGKLPPAPDDVEVVCGLRAFLATTREQIIALRRAGVNVSCPLDYIQDVARFVNEKVCDIDRVMLHTKPAGGDIGVLARAG